MTNTRAQVDSAAVESLPTGLTATGQDTYTYDDGAQTATVSVDRNADRVYLATTDTVAWTGPVLKYLAVQARADPPPDPPPPDPEE